MVAVELKGVVACNSSRQVMRRIGGRIEFNGDLGMRRDSSITIDEYQQLLKRRLVSSQKVFL